MGVCFGKHRIMQSDTITSVSYLKLDLLAKFLINSLNSVWDLKWILITTKRFEKLNLANLTLGTQNRWRFILILEKPTDKDSFLAEIIPRTQKLEHLLGNHCYLLQLGTFLECRLRMYFSCLSVNKICNTCFNFFRGEKWPYQRFQALSEWEMAHWQKRIFFHTNAINHTANKWGYLLWTLFSVKISLVLGCHWNKSQQQVGSLPYTSVFRP